jgi:hypothetical protein
MLPLIGWFVFVEFFGLEELLVDVHVSYST